ncbi:MAG: response regulator [Spirochaetota bacterium]|nr:response regulator [Spirochaetota bacterium]
MKDSAPSNVVVIDDEEGIRYLLQKRLSNAGYNVISLEKAEDILYLLNDTDTKIDLIITDIKLRKMDGITLLRHIKMLDEPIPVLIITGQGNIEDAIKALRYGAHDFIRKPFDLNEITSTVKDILRRKKETKLAENIGQFIKYQKMIFNIPVDITICNTISYVLTQNLTSMGFCNRTTSENISLSLCEAIENAMFHGNLEIKSDVVKERGIRGFYEEVEKRKKDKRFQKRQVRILQELTEEYVEYIIEDDGPGFNYSSLPELDIANISGRGLLIINIHMDEVDWNEKGNMIRLRKYRVS